MKAPAEESDSKKRAAMKMRVKDAIKYPHIQAIIIIVIAFAITTVGSILLFNSCGAISAILASISAGCFTGIVFYIVTNLRNNEIQGVNKELEKADEKYELAKKTMKLCRDSIENISNSKKRISNICRHTGTLIAAMSALCFDAPRTTKIIKDYPQDYAEKVKLADSAKELLQKEESDLNEEEAKMALANIMLFCSATKGILLEPMLELMIENARLENSVL